MLSRDNGDIKFLTKGDNNEVDDSADNNINSNDNNIDANENKHNVQDEKESEVREMKLL